MKYSNIKFSQLFQYREMNKVYLVRLPGEASQAQCKEPFGDVVWDVNWLWTSESQKDL